MPPEETACDLGVSSQGQVQGSGEEGLSPRAVFPVPDGDPGTVGVGVLPDGNRSAGRRMSEFVGDLKREPLKKHIVRSIIISGSDEDACEVVRKLRSAVTGNRYNTTGGIFAFVPHLGGRPHVHVWHDCNLPRGMCSCAALKGFRNAKEGPGVLATRVTVPGFRALRNVSMEEAQAAKSDYFSNTIK